ncbi:GmrSD restriction endonuclease domain-containing protein [Alkalibaculum sporogenes]|nr:DUF262 domain-containing protein [Alkalibaculum sporogenes]
MSSSFKSNDTNVADILKLIANGENQLPDFQRGWVWDDNRIKALIASISNSYPVGALMFLEYGGDNVRFKYRLFEGAKADGKPDVLVLDGQQRLTSIFGSMYCRDAVSTRTDKNKAIKRFYYLDINKCLNSTVDRDEAILSIPQDKMLKSDFGRKIDLDLSIRKKEFENHMFPLNIVYDLIACAMWQNEYQAYHNYAPEILQRYAKFNVDVLVPIQTYKVPVITLDKTTPKEAVCQVFENVNTGGVSLTVFELITATFAADNFELRKDWDKRHEDFINKSALSVNNLNQAVLAVVSSTDFLTAITLLTRYNIKKNGGEAVSCKRKDVLRLSLIDYKQYANQLSEGLIKSATFLKEQRIFSARDLPYSTQLIPMAVVFALLGNKTNDVTVKDKIARWYWCGVFGEMYGGANETRYANDVVGLMSWIEENGSEPETVSRAFFNPTRLLSLQTRLSAAYKGVMALILHAGAQDFISGSAMDFTTFLDESTDIHHIFPHAYCEGQCIERVKWNSIINKTPLFARTNRILGGNAPSSYINYIKKNGHVTSVQLDKHIASHLIDVASIRSDNFNQFIICRAKALLDLIGSAMGKTITNRDSDEVIAAFGQKL